MEKPQPNAALLALHEAARARGEDPLAVTPVVTVGEPEAWPAPFTGVPVDWHQEQLNREAAERARRAEEAQRQLEEEVEAEQEVVVPTPPAPKRSRWHRSGA